MRDKSFDNNLPSIVMSKPPTVSDFASTLSAVIAPVSKQLPEAIDKPVMIRPDFDTEVLWRPPRLSRSRTVSTESSDSDTRRSVSFSEPSPPMEIRPRTRRFSFTEMIFGSPSRFSSARHSPTIAEDSDTAVEKERKRSIVDDERFRDFLRHHKNAFGE